MEPRKQPSTTDAQTLFGAVEQKYPHGTLGEGTWYLITVSHYLDNIFIDD